MLIKCSCGQQINVTPSPGQQLACPSCRRTLELTPRSQPYIAQSSSGSFRYRPSPRHGSSEPMVVPGAMLMVVAGLNYCQNVLSIVMATRVLIAPDRGDDAGQGVILLIAGIAGLIGNSVLMFGSIQMIRMRSLELAKVASALAMLPFLGLGCCLGLPFGIWATVLLRKPEVSEQFMS